MCRARHLEPFIRRRLVRAELAAHAVRQDLRSAAGDGLQAAAVAQLPKNLLDGQARDFREVRDLHAGEALHVELREALVQRLHDAEVILERPGRMEPRNDVESCEVRVAHGVLDDRDGLRLRHRIGALLIRIAAKGAELTVGCADIRQIDVAVDIVVDDVPALLAAHMVSQSAEPGEVMAVEKPYPVLSRQALPAHHLLFDILIFACSQQNKKPPYSVPLPAARIARIACKLPLLYHRTFQIHRSKVIRRVRLINAMNMSVLQKQ